MVTSWQLLFKSLNEGKQTKKTRLENSVVNCRGSLAWLGRQTHNLECKRGQSPYAQKSRARIPSPAPLFKYAFAYLGHVGLMSMVADRKPWFKAWPADVPKTIRYPAVPLQGLLQKQPKNIPIRQPSFTALAKSLM